jgi:hypothetical protein
MEKGYGVRAANFELRATGFELSFEPRVSNQTLRIAAYQPRSFCPNQDAPSGAPLNPQIPNAFRRDLAIYGAAMLDHLEARSS